MKKKPHELSYGSNVNMFINKKEPKFSFTGYIFKLYALEIWG